MKTLRQLIIESLMKDIASNRCEFESALQDPCLPYALPEWVPLTADGYIDAPRITRENLETLTDKQLLDMFDGNACLRYR